MAVDPAQLRLVYYPDPALRRKTRLVDVEAGLVRAVAEKMLQIMREAPGVGLAAPQVGLDWRMFVANATGQPEDDKVFINPRLIEPGRDLADAEEGCLSLPDITATIRRPAEISIEANDLDGESFRLTDNGLAARVWQHEYDHLDGVLILDRMNTIDKLSNRKAIRDLEQRGRR